MIRLSITILADSTISRDSILARTANIGTFGEIHKSRTPMTAQTKRIVSIVLMAIPTLVLTIGGSLKIIGAEPQSVIQFLAQAGFDHRSIVLLGCTELIIAALLLYPKTTKIGFLLASCYFGGAFCLELGGGQAPAAAVFLTILWVGMFLRHKEMFLA
jgi:hypothetical protein